MTSRLTKYPNGKGLNAKSCWLEKKENNSFWIQCTQCGHGFSTTKAEEAADERVGCTCSYCGLGVLKTNEF